MTGRVVLVTGASRGIGAAAAAAIAESGASVIAHYGTYADGAAEAVAALPDDRKLLVQADLSQPGSARALWREAVAWRRRIDVVVANAAIAPETPFEGSDEEWDAGWDAVLRVNVLETVSLIREAVAHFRASGGGIVITVSSWAAQQGSAIPSLSAYAASKAAVKAVTQTVARNYARDGVLAYVVAPGIVRTRMSEISATSRGGIDNVNAILAMGEMAPADEVGSLIAFLASGACRHLTGATIDLNGASYIR
ncbi:MAG: SDR family oxidoreductase [Thermoleophilia bacterium]|nr:SDR family oxidoreductase [Thermoleophilia bacterium]